MSEESAVVSRSGPDGPADTGPQPQTAPPPANGLARRAPLIVAGALVALVAAGYFTSSWLTFGRYQVSTDDAYVGVRAATLSPKVAGYIKEIAVPDNAVVKAGDLIARIDPGDYELAVRAAAAQADTQRATVARFDKQVASQQAMVDQAKAQAASARAGAVRAELELKRQVELAEKRINTPQALEQAQALRDQASAAVKAADAAIASAEANVAVFVAERSEAESTLKQVDTQLDKARRDLSFAEIRAPYDGVFGNRAVQVGDYVQPAQRLASLVPLQSVYIDANFKETQIARLSPGQPATITVDAISGTRIEGSVESLAPASGSVFSLLPPDNATGNFTKIVQRIAVRIAVPEEIARRSLLRPGMSVVVTVDTRDGARAKDKPVVTSSSTN